MRILDHHFLSGMVALARRGGQQMMRGRRRRELGMFLLGEAARQCCGHLSTGSSLFDMSAT
jgi:hypothetical protein